MVFPKNEAKPSCAFDSSLDTSFIEIGSKEIYAIGAAQIVGPVPVEIPHPRTLGGVDDRSDPEVILNVSLILERNTMAINESKIRNRRLELFTQGNCFGRPLAKKLRQTLESLAALFLDVRRRRIARKKRAVAV